MVFVGLEKDNFEFQGKMIGVPLKHFASKLKVGHRLTSKTKLCFLAA